MQPILIDDREGEIVTHFDVLGLPYEIKRLDIGDMVLGRAVIERKEATDFILSIMDGRLENQIKQMQENFEKCCLVVHGNILTTESSMKHKSIIGMLSSVCARTNISVVVFQALPELCYFSYQFLCKSNDDKGFKVHMTNKSKRKTDLNHEILQLIEGVSFNKADVLLSKFGSIRRVILAEKEELMKVKGIGKVLTEKIHALNILYI